MITAQIASVPHRVDSLNRTVNSLLGQVNMLFVALNNYDYVPNFLLGDRKIVYAIMDNKFGDAAKFYDADQRSGYVLTCDDDLVYPPDYAQYMVDGVKKHGGIVSLLGKIYPRPATSYRGNFVQIFRVLNPVHGDHVVDVCGTGAMCYNTNDFKISMDMFERKNMADLWVAKAAAEQGVKITALAHPKGYIKHIRHGRSIWSTTTGENPFQTKVLNSFLK